MSMDIILIELVASLTTIVIFTLAGVLDWWWREIPPTLWIMPVIIGISVNILYYFLYCSNYFATICKYQFQLQLLQLILSLILLCIISILVFIIKIIGGADFLAVASFIALYPFNRLLVLGYSENIIVLQLLFFLPPILWVLIIYSVIMISLILFNLLNNLRFHKEIKTLRVPLTNKILYTLFCRFMYVKEYRRKKFYYPVYVQSIISRVSFNIYEDDEVWKQRLSNIPDNLVIVVSWGIPMITFMSLAVATYLILYNTLLLMLY